MKLRFQLALLVVLSIVASLSAAMVSTLHLTRVALEKNAQSSAQDAVDDILHGIESLPPVADERIEKELDGALRKHPRVTAVELVLSTSTHSVNRSQPEGVSTHAHPAIGPPVPVTAPPAHPAPRTLSAHMGDAGTRIFEVSAPLSSKSRIGSGHINVTFSLDSVDKLLETQRDVTLYVAAIAVLLALLFTVLLADRILGRPLARLGRAMSDVTEGALDRRVDEGGPPEVNAVSQAFNQMLDRLQEADRAIRSFNERLASEVSSATAALSDRNEALLHLNDLLVRAREDLSHKERLAALGQLAAQLAHEVGTPLGSVSGHLQLALASPDCPPAVRERLVIATHEITRVSRIIRDYLDSTRRIEPEIEEVDVGQIVHEAVEVSRGGNASRRGGVGIEVAPEVAHWMTDAGVARQVLVNLVANALDAVATTHDGEPGEVVVRAQLEEGRAPGRARELALRVCDDGPGLSPETLGRLFEPFYTTKGRGKGTGLGLSICRELVQSIGGRIEAASEPGKGTVFTVRLPDGAQIVRRAQTASNLKPVAIAASATLH